MKNYPKISIIIPAFNEEKRLAHVLQSIKEQNYPQEKIEILLIDDKSTDSTVEIAKNFGAKVFENGTHNIERGKSIGIEQAKGELIFFMDADNYLPNKDWLTKTVIAFVKENALGAEAIYFNYDRSRPAADRYCQLFGINDPFPYYLKRQDRLAFGKSEWNLLGKVLKKEKDYFVVQFEKENLPTIGSQGYLMKKEDILKTNWQPYFFHMDTHIKLLEEAERKFVLMRQSIGHNHCDRIAGFLKKVNRNGRLFLQQNNERSYKYGSGSFKPIIIAGFTCLSILIPLKDALAGYKKLKDPAWFLHPILSFTTALIYAGLFLRWKVGKLKRWDLW